MNTLTEERLKELEEQSKRYWPSDYLLDEDVAALIQAARERNRIFQMAKDALDPYKLAHGESNGSVWAKSILEALETPKEILPPASGNSTPAL